MSVWLCLSVSVSVHVSESESVCLSLASTFEDKTLLPTVAGSGRGSPSSSASPAVSATAVDRFVACTCHTQTKQISKQVKVNK